MPKLNGVFVNEYGTRIIYRGVEYVKTEGKPQAGDIVRHDVDGYSYIPKGSFYELRVDSDGDISFIDEDGDDVEPDDEFTVFRRVVKDDFITHEGRKYRKVARKANRGELAVIVANKANHKFQIGEIVRMLNDVTAEYLDERDWWHVGYADYLVLEPVVAETSAPRLKVGDYAKVVSLAEYSGRTKIDVNIGEIFKILEVDDSHIPYRGERIDDGYTTWFNVDMLVRATDAEVAAARKQAAERVKWAAIGRNVNEYEAGDVVRIVENSGVVGVDVGDIGVITEFDEDGTFCVETARAKSGNWHRPEQVELVAPVESRFDRE